MNKIIPEIWNNKYLIQNQQFPGGEKDMLTREIDLFIHNNPMIRIDNTLHIEHQKKIIKLIQGREKEVLNDENVIYPYRNCTYFNGETGTMSNILNSCFFSLYKYGLTKDVQVNLEDDICIIFMLLESIKIHKMHIKDKESLNYIIKELKKRNNLHFLFNKTKWEAFIEYFNDESKSFGFKTVSQQYNVFNVLGDPIKEFLKVIDIKQSRIYEQYEYGPNYLNKSDDITYSMDRIERFNTIKDIFLDTVSNK